MHTPIPTVSQHMHRSPHTIGRDQPLARAHEVMRRNKIRHLPVLDGGVLVGVVSERDLHLVETLRDVDPEDVTVEEAMNGNVYVAAPDTPLVEVLETMASKKLGCAVLVQEQHVVGVFTTVDVCRAFAERLRASACDC